MAMKKNFLPEPKTFEHEQFGKIRFFNDGDELWFVAADVAKVLDIKNVRQNIAEFPDDEKMTVSNTYGHSGQRGGAQFLTLVSEPGFYRLIFISRKPEAEKFKRWVFHDVLPSIRRNGYYIAPHQMVITIEGRENYNKFKAKYPKGMVELKSVLMEIENLDEINETYRTFFMLYCIKIKMEAR